MISAIHLSGGADVMDLRVEAQRRLVSNLVAAGMESEAATQRERTGGQILGVAAICRERPHHRPAKSKKSSTPFPCRQQSGTPSALRRLCVVRCGGVPGGFQEASRQEPRGVVPGRQLPYPRCRSWPGSPPRGGTSKGLSAGLTTLF
jgi:hypothetical protein